MPKPSSPSYSSPWLNDAFYLNVFSFVKLIASSFKECFVKLFGLLMESDFKLSLVQTKSLLQFIFYSTTGISKILQIYKNDDFLNFALLL